MKKYNKLIGNYGEDLAKNFLNDKGYKIIATNFRSSTGEIDIIARHNDILIFIEVKSRFSSNYGFPIEAVNYIKYKKLLNTAKYYLYKNKITNNFIRFDVIEVFLDSESKKSKINHIEDAFRV